MNAITASTGHTTTSCGHTYHLACFVRWIQNPEHENCPLCRADVAPEEKVAPRTDDESEASSEASGSTRLSDVADDDDDGQNYEGVGDGWGWERGAFPVALRIPRYNAESHAMWVFRKTFAEPAALAPATASVEPKPSSRSYIDNWDSVALRMRKGHYLAANVDAARGYESD